MSRIVLISSLNDGYRRGGLKFSQEPIEVNLDELEENAAKAIESDHHLTIKPLKISDDCSKCQKRLEELEAENSLLKNQLAQLQIQTVPKTLPEAIAMLDAENPEHFTKSGKPDVKALELLMGTQVSAADRDDAWQAMQEEITKLEA